MISRENTGSDSKMKMKRKSSPNILSKSSNTRSKMRSQSISMSINEMMDLMENAQIRRIKRKIESKSVNIKHKPKQKWRKVLYEFLTSDFVQYAIICLIVVSSIMPGIATFDFIKSNDNTVRAFEITNDWLLYIFTIELGINMVVYDLAFFKYSWFVLDLIVILPSYFTHSGMKAFRAFRVFRTVRLIGKVEVLKKVFLGMYKSGTQIIAIVLILLIQFYIFAVMFTDFYGACYEKGCYCEDIDWKHCSEEHLGVDYFGRLDYSFMTLFVLLTMDDWGVIISETRRMYPWCWISMIIFMILSAYVTVNLIVAVLCDSLQVVREDEVDDVSDNEIIDDIFRSSVGESSNHQIDLHDLRSHVHRKRSTINVLGHNDRDNMFMSRSFKGLQTAKDDYEVLRREAVEADSNLMKGIYSIFDEVDSLQEKLTVITSKLSLTHRGPRTPEKNFCQRNNTFSKLEINRYADAVCEQLAKELAELEELLEKENS